MKILHVVPYLPKSSGVTTFVDALTAECVKLGHECKVVVGDFNWGEQECTQMERVQRLSVTEGLETLQNDHWDVLHVHALWLPFIHRLVKVAHQRGVAIVWSIHGSLSPWAFWFKWWKKLPVWWLWQRRDIKLAKVLHVTSAQEADWVNAYHFNLPIIDVPLGTYGIVEQDCQVGRNHEIHEIHEKGPSGRTASVKESTEYTEGASRQFSVQSSEFGVQSLERRGCDCVASTDNKQPQTANCKPQTDVPRLRLLFVGRVAPVKSLPKLIEAWAKANLAQWELRIVGNGEPAYVEMLKAQAVALGISDQVHFAGPRYGEDLLKEYRSADALALVSETENFGAVVVDALAHGMPVITSTGTRWSEVEERQCGWWVDNDVDSLTKVLKSLGALSDAERAQMGENGKRLIQEKYTWPAVAKQMSAFYERLV